MAERSLLKFRCPIHGDAAICGCKPPNRRSIFEEANEVESIIERVYKRLYTHKHTNATAEQESGWLNACVAFKTHALRELRKAAK